MKRPDETIEAVERYARHAKATLDAGGVPQLLNAPIEICDILDWIAHLESQLEGYRRQETGTMARATSAAEDRAEEPSLAARIAADMKAGTAKFVGPAKLIERVYETDNNLHPATVACKECGIAWIIGERACVDESHTHMRADTSAAEKGDA